MNILVRRSLRSSAIKNVFAHGDHASKSNLKMPANPTIYGSFGAQISKEQMEKIMDPKGFLDYDEQQRLEKEEAAQKRLREQLEKINIQMKSGKGKPTEMPFKLDKNGFPPEGGYRYLGLEPTRYGDWDIKGRVSDF